MQRANAFVIALLLGAAVVIGSVAALKTAELSGASAKPAVSSQALAKRSARLDRAEIALRKALSRRPPKLPKVPRLLGRDAGCSGPRRRAGPPRIVRYVRPAPIVVTTHRPAERRTTQASMSTTKAVAAMTNHVTRLYALAVSVARPVRRLGRRRNPPVADHEPPSRRSARARARPPRAAESGTSRWSSGGSSPGAGTVYHVALAQAKPRRSRPRRSSTKRRSPRQRPPRRRSVLVVPVGPGRDPAAADHHEDLVMERHEFRAMGTEIELMLDLPRGPRRRHAFSEIETRVRADRGALCRASFPSSRALHPQPQRNRSRRAPTFWPPPSSRSQPASAPAAGSTRPSTTRSSPPATTARSSRFPPTDAANGNGGHACGGRVEIDRFTRTIRLAAGVRLDLGGIGKGYAVDRAAERLSTLGPCLVNAGGDVAVRGRRWPVGVETANGFVTLELVSGALATSGRDRRRWRRNGEEQHHLIDPATGRPSSSDLAARDRRRQRRPPRPRCSRSRSSSPGRSTRAGGGARRSRGRARHRRRRAP